MALVNLNIIFTSSRLLLVRESSLLTTITELKASAWDHSQLPPPFCPSSDSPAQVQTRWNLCVYVCDFFQGAKDCSKKNHVICVSDQRSPRTLKASSPQQPFSSANLFLLFHSQLMDLSCFIWTIEATHLLTTPSLNPQP